MLSISNERLKHSLEVARLMKKSAEDAGWNKQKCEEMFVLGFLHDIGYEFAEQQCDHASVGGEMLKNQGYKYWKEVSCHGKLDIEYFSEEEVELITKGALYRYKTGRYKYKYGYAIILLLNTGLRVGELLALKWEHVDFDKRQLYICETRGQIKDRTDSNRKYTTASRSTKTESSCRYIPISKKALEALRYLESLGYHSPYVLANADGENGVVSYRNLFRVLSNVLDDSGINHGSLHTLRHTFATRLFKKGVDIKVISELLGHSDISITYNIYTHVIAEQKQKAIDILDEL